MSAALHDVNRYTGVSVKALEKLAERIEPIVISKLFGQPDKSEPKLKRTTG